jgi:hypothetical protein
MAKAGGNQYSGVGLLAAIEERLNDVVDDSCGSIGTLCYQLPLWKGYTYGRNKRKQLWTRGGK